MAINRKKNNKNYLFYLIEKQTNFNFQFKKLDPTILSQKMYATKRRRRNVKK